MTTEPQGAKRGARVSRTDLEYFFDSSILPGLQGGEIEFQSPSVRERHNTAARYLETIRDEGDDWTSTTFRVQSSDVIESLQTTFYQLTTQFAFRHLNDRVNKLEADLADLHGQVTVHVASGHLINAAGGEFLRDAASQVEAVRKAVAEAFGNYPTDVSILPSADEDHPVTITIDLSHAPVTSINEARKSGARRRFYECVDEVLSQTLLRRLDFDFRFPAP